MFTEDKELFLILLWGNELRPFPFSTGVLNLNFGAAYAMKDAIKFLYTGEVHVSMERVRDLLEVADYLQISEMTEVCVKYLKGIELTLENCVQVRCAVNVIL